jgi:Spy/CpxP family protein refolding chaperone
MNRKSVVSLVLGAAILLGLGVLSSVTQAHSGRPMMTDEQRQQMMDFHGGGYGMGSGMMGPGMMAPGMMGHGMMGHMGPMWMLNLTAEQRAQIRGIHDEQRTQRWSIMGKIMDESSQLHVLYAAEKWDPKAIGAVYGKIFDLKRQMIEASISAHNRWEAVLTQEQRDQLDKWRWEMFIGGGTGRGGFGPMHRGMMNQ